MELRPTGNSDTSNPVTMSVMEYLAKKGREAMSGICKYPEIVCLHMTVLNGKSYCDVTPCQLKDELPKQSNAQRIRSMTDEELAKFLTSFQNTFGEEYEGMMSCLEWLKQPVEERNGKDSYGSRVGKFIEHK